MYKSNCIFILQTTILNLINSKDFIEIEWKIKQVISNCVLTFVHLMATFLEIVSMNTDICYIFFGNHGVEEYSVYIWNGVSHIYTTRFTI